MYILNLNEEKKKTRGEGKSQSGAAVDKENINKKQ